MSFLQPVVRTRVLPWLRSQLVPKASSLRWILSSSLSDTRRVLKVGKITSNHFWCRLSQCQQMPVAVFRRTGRSLSYKGTNALESIAADMASGLAVDLEVFYETALRRSLEKRNWVSPFRASTDHRLSELSALSLHCFNFRGHSSLMC